MAVGTRTPSQVVGAQVRALRRKREWSQTKLAERLDELGSPGWRQSKITRIERGQLARLPLEDVFELAAALDVSPTYLLAPSSVWNEKGDKPLMIRIGPRIARWPQEVRKWIDREQPILKASNYKTNEEAKAGAQFFYFDSRPLGEWQVDELVRQQKEEQ